MSESLNQQILSLFETELNILVPAADTDLIEEGLLDSLVFVDLIMKLEGVFGIEVPIAELDLDQFRSVARICDFIASVQTGDQLQENAA